MARRCDLSIVLEQPGPRFAVGDTLSGFVGVEVNQDATCRDLKLTLRWRTHGRGNTKNADVEVLHLFTGEWSAGETHIHPFQLTLPEEGPLSYHGTYLNLDWELEARADIPWALDPKTTQDLVLVQSSPPHTLTRGSAWRGRLSELSHLIRTGVFTFMALGLFALAATGLLGSPTGLLHGFSLFSIIPILFFLGGFIVLWIGWKNHLARWKLGEVELLVPEEARAGETVEVTLRLHPRQTLKLQGATLKLRGKEVVVSGSGTNRRTHVHIFHEEERSLSDPRVLEGGQPVELRGELVLPDHAPPSFAIPDNELRWEVTVDLDLPHWPDWRRTVLLAVG